MGFTQCWYGHLNITPAPNDEFIEKFQKFHDTYQEQEEPFDKKYNRIAAGLPKDHNKYMPGKWCQWIIWKNSLVFDGEEKFYHAEEWTWYLIKKWFKPNGYTLNGSFASSRGESGEQVIISVSNNNFLAITLDKPIINLSDDTTGEPEDYFKPILTPKRCIKIIGIIPSHTI
jgi:hypothetical protein